jgi:uncharacterized protein YdeI (YjbR/CyaY-like superfamily)
MGKRDPRVDVYIAKSADFAKPILRHIRSVVHAACPEVEETLKWSFPHFVHKGMLCHMAAFKGHCSFGFWKRALIFKGKGPDESGNKAMGRFGRITAIADLPRKKALTGYIKEAARLNEAGVKLPPKTKPKERKPLVVPAGLKSALKKNKQAMTAFENFSYTHRKEYVEWITEAKTEDTRLKRLETAIQWMAEGKSRNWKYLKC